MSDDEFRRLDDVVVFAGTDDEDYVNDVCNILGVQKGELVSKYHTDSDPYLRINENIGGKDTYFIIRYHKRTRDDLFQMLNFANAAMNEGARSVNVVETYMGCSRQERKSKPGEAVTLQVKANCMMSNGIDTYATFAAHSDASILGFDPHRTKFKNFPLWPVMIQVISNILGNDVKAKAVGPDAGAAKPVRDILDSTTVKEDERFSKDLAIVDKDRVHQKNGKTKSGAVIGDVNGLVAVLFDDESVTGGTICNAAKICKESGAIGTYVTLSHAKFAMDAGGMQKIAEALLEGIVNCVVTTDSCCIPGDFYSQLGIEESSGRVIIIPTQPLVAEYIRRSAENKGVPYLHSSRGVLRAYDRIAARLRWVEEKQRRDDFKAEYEENFRRELDLYNRLARPVLGDYVPIVRSHNKLVGCGNNRSRTSG